MCPLHKCHIGTLAFTRTGYKNPVNPAAAAAAKSLQSSPTLCDPIDGSPPGSSVHGILQARMLEEVAMPSSRGSFQTLALI